MIITGYQIHHGFDRCIYHLQREDQTEQHQADYPLLQGYPQDLWL